MGSSSVLLLPPHLFHPLKLMCYFNQNYLWYLYKKKEMKILTDNNIGWFSSEFWHYSLETCIFSYFSCGVHILYRKQGTQTKQEDFSEGCNELRKKIVILMRKYFFLFFTWVWVTITFTQSVLASISCKHLRARASQPSVWVSRSDLRVTQSSRFPAPSNPPTLFPRNKLN